MKKNLKYIAVGAAAAILAFAAISFSCTGKKDRGTANTAFAQTENSQNQAAVNIPNASLNIIEALQEANRSISKNLLPSVVEIDVTETKKRSKNPFGDIPFFFFGTPREGEEGQEEYKQQGLGSGVIIRRNGNTLYVLTNNHVAGSATEITVKLNDGRKFDGKLVGADKRMDIALVSFESNDKTIPLAKLGDSDSVQTGDFCYAMGAPLGYSQSVTQGIVSATGRSGGDIGNINDFIQTDAAINQGNSGGPLVNIYGEVIGINTWIASGSGGNIGLGFAIPINNVKRAIDEFIADGKITYGWIGVSLIDVKNEYKDSLNVGDVEGAFASQVFMNSPAQKAGIQAGDYIIELNGHKVKSVDQLVRDVAVLPVGKTTQFKLIRGGKTQSVTVKVEERTDEVSTDDSKLWPGFIAVPLTEEIRKELKVEKGVEGVVITNVIPKTPAAALRLQNNDVITAVNGKKISNLSEFYNAMDLTKTKTIQFDVWNEAGTITTGTWNVK
ncbi:Do family serine endopeptidase [Treponema sp.]|uniref:Do family serine endopeptidase n=1 Tax=Treponema sp. TaxID=166 RepID=UPI00298E7A33|nr:Do family serine endopeptidase [Treponema sp.]